MATFACWLPAVAVCAEERDSPQILQTLFRTEVVYPQEPGEVQVTAGVGLEGGRGETALAMPIATELGLTGAWQIGGEWTALAAHWEKGGEHAAGVGDLEIATRDTFMHIGGSNVHASPGFALGEITWENNTWNHWGDENELSWTHGLLVWDAPGAWEVGVGVPVGLTSDAARIGGVLLATVELDSGWEGFGR